jgi:N4-gp56 family major capsid protein
MAQQLWVTNSLGGHLTNNKLSKSIRNQNVGEFVFKQFVDVKEDLGKNSGDTVFFDKILKIDTKGGTLAETATIPENKWKVVKDSVVVTEIGNSVPYTNKLETLAEFDPENISTRTLKNDQLEVLDSLAYDQFYSAKFVAVCTSTASTVFTTNGTATITASANMSDANVRDVVDYMEQKLIPTFSDGNYRAIVSVNTRRGIYDFLQAVAQYADPQYRHNKEVGQYYSVRFALDKQFLSDAVGNGSQYGEAVFFGQEAVLEAIALLPEIRIKIPTDYGRSKGVAWLAIEAFKKMWDLANDDLNSTGKGIERIIKVTSA